MIAVEQELITVASMLMKAAVKAGAKAVPAIRASTTVVAYEVKILVTPATIAKMMIFFILSLYFIALKMADKTIATTKVSSMVNQLVAA